MLEKYLPKLQNLKIKILQSLRRQSRNQLVNQQRHQPRSQSNDNKVDSLEGFQNSDSTTFDPNFLVHAEVDSFLKHSVLLPFLQTTLAAVFIIFALLLLINNVQNYQIKKLKEEQAIWVEILNDGKQIQEQATLLSKKVSYFKKTLLRQQKISDKVLLIENSVPSEVTIISFKVDYSSFSYVLEGPGTLYFTNLISTLFDSDKVSEIIINKAEYSRSRDSFRVEMEGSFK